MASKRVASGGFSRTSKYAERIAASLPVPNGHPKRSLQSQGQRWCSGLALGRDFSPWAIVTCRGSNPSGCRCQTAKSHRPLLCPLLYRHQKGEKDGKGNEDLQIGKKMLETKQRCWKRNKDRKGNKDLASSLFPFHIFFISHSSNNYYPMEKLISNPSLSGTILVDIVNFVIQTVFQ